MIRVLQVYPQLNNAGTERVIFNLYENINTSFVQFDFLVERKGELDEKILNMGGRIFYIEENNNRKYFNKVKEFFKNHPEYQIIHTHTHARMGTVLKAAKECGVKCRIAHSHNARNDLPQIAAVIKGIPSLKIEKNANCFFACSKNAAKWLFPHKYEECQILYNGIRVKDYFYDVKKREEIRKKLSIKEDEITIIHVGRFAKQKNHEYLIQVLQSLNLKLNGKMKAILIGTGPLQEHIRECVNSLGISDKVHFLNNRSDVNELLSAGDVFVFPSLHEGLGIVVIEAQANGLPCVVSDAVPNEADMGIGLLNTLTLSQSADEWALEIIKQYENRSDRESYYDSVGDSKYNIQKIAKFIEEFYIKIQS